MKKTLVAVAVAAFATSASAVTVLNADGTKVDFEGSLRVILEQASSKTKDNEGNNIDTKRGHSNLRNAGSRFGVKVKHELGEDFYALGRLEFRFDGKKGADGWGDLYTKRAYVGLGSQQYGELIFGRQVVIADDLSQSNDYEYGLISKGDYIPTDGKQVIRYNYSGFDGLQLSANYIFADSRDANGEVKVNALQNSYGVGALYNVDNLDLRFGYGHTNYKSGKDIKSRKEGVLFSAGYTLDALKLILDTGYRYGKVGDDKAKAFYVSPGFEYQATPKSKVYGNYLYERDQVKDLNKTKTHGFLLGADYKFHKQVVAFVEGKVAQIKGYTNKAGDGYDYVGKTTDKAIGVGLRVYW